eukprot:scaffold35461_cov35-Tisochrysis_lutea.AAC.1
MPCRRCENGRLFNGFWHVARSSSERDGERGGRCTWNDPPPLSQAILSTPVSIAELPGWRTSRASALARPSLASSGCVTTETLRPSISWTRCRNSPPFGATRNTSVAIALASTAPSRLACSSIWPRTRSPRCWISSDSRPCACWSALKGTGVSTSSSAGHTMPPPSGSTSATSILVPPLPMSKATRRIGLFL